MDRQRLTSKAHYDRLKVYLQHYRVSPNTRLHARIRLAKLTANQFHDLTSDVHEEIIRRNSNGIEVSLPPFEENFHPRRNQARVKMANLTNSRFQTLASDVLFELVDRFPEFEQVDDSNPEFNITELHEGQ